MVVIAVAVRAVGPVACQAHFAPDGTYFSCPWLGGWPLSARLVPWVPGAVVWLAWVSFLLRRDALRAEYPPARGRVGPPRAIPGGPCWIEPGLEPVHEVDPFDLDPALFEELPHVVPHHVVPHGAREVDGQFEPKLGGAVDLALRLHLRPSFLSAPTGDVGEPARGPGLNGSNGSSSAAAESRSDFGRSARSGRGAGSIVAAQGADRRSDGGA